MKNSEEQIVIYQTEDGKTAIDVRIENETVWLSQAQMANLFQKDQSVIARHISNVSRRGNWTKTVICKLCIEPLAQRRQQAHRRHAVPLVPQQQRHPLSRRRHQAYCRQYTGGPNLNDCREQTGGEGRDGESGGESDQQEQLTRVRTSR